MPWRERSAFRSAAGSIDGPVTPITACGQDVSGHHGDRTDPVESPVTIRRHTAAGLSMGAPGGQDLASGSHVNG